MQNIIWYVSEIQQYVSKVLKVIFPFGLGIVIKK